MFSWSHLGWVALGGALGTAARLALTLAFGDALGPALVPLINVVGAFALGAVIGGVARRPADPRTRAVQMFVGTGVLGGFTTYSALANDTARLLLEGPVALGVVNGLGTVLVGAVASWAGVAIGARLPRRGRTDGDR